MTNDFYVTKAARARIEEIRESAETRLRIAVQGGGCAGFSYTFLLDEALNTDDCMFGASENSAKNLSGNLNNTLKNLEENADIPSTEENPHIVSASNTAEGIVVIDETSLDLLRGSTLDFQDDLAASMFVIKNPSATAGCGCGNSFSI